jgi:hypothetical protein
MENKVVYMYNNNDSNNSNDLNDLNNIKYCGDDVVAEENVAEENVAEEKKLEESEKLKESEESEENKDAVETHGSNEARSGQPMTMNGGINQEKNPLSDDEDEDEEGGFGGGYASSSDNVSSISTNALLTVDPLYYRLTKFLQAGGSDGSDGPLNVAEILMKININIEKLNELMTTHVKKK